VDWARSGAPGEQISEVQLAAHLKMSRGPVREAVQRLVQEGLLVSHRNRGVFVVELDGSDIDNVYRGRRSVEKEAARTVYERGIPARLVTRLERILQNIELHMNAGDWLALAREDLQIPRNDGRSRTEATAEPHVLHAGRRDPAVPCQLSTRDTSARPQPWRDINGCSTGSSAVITPSCWRRSIGTRTPR
jgi:DNA-binding transcriptional regulator YhcF (GntR family)